MEIAEKEESFLEWLRTKGAKVDLIEIKKDPNGENGVYAKKKISPNEVTFSVPQELVIDSEISRALLPFDSMGLPDIVAQIAYIVHLKFDSDKITNTKWLPYIRILPEKFSTIGFFTEAELKLLKGTPIEQSAIEKISLVKNMYNQLVEKLKQTGYSEKEYTWDKFLWGYSVYASRSFTKRLLDLKFDGPVSEVLVPLFDMVNHKPKTKVTWENSNNNLNFTPGTEYNVGEEIFNNYGPKSNEELLMGYGFCIENNPFDYLRVKLNYEKDPLVAEKKMWFLNEKFGLNKLDLFITKLESFSNDLIFKILRVMVMNNNETFLCHSAFTDLDKDLGFISYRNELLMINTFEKLLYNLKNKIEAHVDIPDHKTYNVVNVLVYREDSYKFFVLQDLEFNSLLEKYNICEKLYSGGVPEDTKDFVEDLSTQVFPILAKEFPEISRINGDTEQRLLWAVGIFDTFYISDEEEGILLA
ncbi:hypothetical protein BB558_000010 [Smittium angustum]|uniref:SET domain-containing protein n=1 Tax=Smittium angustum TaxID=133377 RepID=A0A2U1JFD6_SMIAN|nr:hypothetical protein BB558_000010 [Smittium angustum]